MKILVVTGTEIKGCTYRMKEIFLDCLREGNEITEYVLAQGLPTVLLRVQDLFSKE